MILDISEGSGVSVFQIIELAQIHYRGDHFCALAGRINYTGCLYFESCKYRPPIHENEIPNWVKFLSAPDEPICVFEHFLQSIRKKFLGIPTNFIRVEATINWQRVWVDMR